MKIGAVMFFTTDSMQPAPLGRALEERGFESLWVPEHTHIPSSRKTPYPAGGPLIRPYYDIMDPFLALNTAATATTRLKIGTGIALLTQRDPIVTAKVVSSIDQLSNGRFLFGVGNGWNQDEIENHGTVFASRHKLARERIEAMKTIWTEEEPEYHGEFVNFDKMKQWPKPSQKPHPPIIVGGAFPYAAQARDPLRRRLDPPRRPAGEGWRRRRHRQVPCHGQGSRARSRHPAHHHLPRARQDRWAALLPGNRRRPRHLHPAGGERGQAHAHHRSLGRAQASTGRLTMPAPKFGLALSFQVHQGLGEPWDKAYREGIELAAEANRLGFDSIWVSEHHGEADGYCPSPVVACAALAVAAPDCRIGQAVALAPLHGHPLRLAEDLSVLDNLSGGRVEIGLGQGYRPAEFESFGWNYKKRTTAFEESLDVLSLAWRGERFDYEGRVYKVKDGLLRPPPIRPGPLPLWIGAAAPVARARAVRHRAGLLVAPLIELEHLVRQIGSFDDEAQRQNAGRLPHALMREILVGDSAADAIKRHQPYLDHVYRVQYAPERTGQTWIDPASGERKPLTGDNPHYLSEAFMQDRWFLGTPAEVAAKLVAWLPRLALDHLIFQARQPGMSLRHAVSDLEAIAKGVMPVVRAKLSSV